MQYGWDVVDAAGFNKTLCTPAASFTPCKKRRKGNTCEQWLWAYEAEYIGDDYEKMDEYKPNKKQAKLDVEIYQQIKSLEAIAQQRKIIESIFRNFTNETLYRLSVVSKLWCDAAYRVLRSKLGISPLLRLWHVNAPNDVSKFSTKIHFHEQFLIGQVNSKNDDGNVMNVPEIQAIISFGSINMEDAIQKDNFKLPSKESVIYGLSEEVIVTSSDFTYIGKSSYGCTLQSLFIPKSEHMNVISFGIPTMYDMNAYCDARTVEQILPLENVNPENFQKVRAVLVLQYNQSNFMTSFLTGVAERDIDILGGIFHAFGKNIPEVSNVSMFNPSMFAVGMMITASDAAKVCTYGINVQSSNAELNFLQMKQQRDGARYGFGILISSESESREIEMEVINNDETDWNCSPPATLKDSATTDVAVQMFRHFLPTTPLIGAVTMSKLIFRSGNDTALYDSIASQDVTVGILLVTY